MRTTHNGALNDQQKQNPVAWISRYTGLYCSALAGLLISTSMAAQDPDIPGAFATETYTQPSVTERATLSQDTANTRVTIVVKDSSLRYIVNEIARQANIRVVYRDSSGIMTRRISLRLEKMKFMDAFAMALRGTGLMASLTPDGQTVGIRSGRDTTSENTTESKGLIIGHVIDSASGKGVVGVTVMVVGTNISVTTQANGLFRLSEVPAGERTLSVRMLGYQTKSMTVIVKNGTTPAGKIVLTQTSTTLTEVVTTATGTQRRAEVSNDIAKINVDSLMQTAPARSITDLLVVARVPGVEITPSSGLPGAPKRIRLRGVSSISQDNDPVVIIDGIWISAATSTGDIQSRATAGRYATTANTFVPSRLDDIDPASIESIEILRGPSAASLYGTDAANGVIVIKTKRGAPGKTRSTIRLSQDWNNVPGQYQPIYIGWGTGDVTDAPRPCNIEQHLALECRQDSVSTLNPNNLPFVSDEAWGRVSGGSLSLTGGAQTLQYSITTSFLDELGPTKLPSVDRIRLRRLNEATPGWLLRPDRLTQRSLSSRLTIQPSSALDIALSVLANKTSSKSAGQYFNFPSGNPSTAIRTAIDTLTFASQSVLLFRDRRSNDAMSGTFGVDVNWRARSWFIPNLTTGIQHIARSDASMVTLRGCVTEGCALPAASPSFYRGEQSVFTGRLTSTFPISLGVLNRFLSIRPSLGTELRRDLAKGISTSADSLALGSEDIATARNTVNKNIVNNSATAGWYTDFLISVWDRFYTSVGFRRDIGSALSTRIRAPMYPKLGTSWIVSNEPFFPHTPWINMLRLRVSYGHSAVQPQASAIRGGFRLGEAVVNGQIVRMIELTKFGNLTLRPERSVELEYGFDAGLFDDWTQIGLTLITKRNRDVLVSRGIATSTGVGSPIWANVSRVLNRSVEATVDSRILERSGMRWSVNMGFSSLLNRVERVGDMIGGDAVDDARIVEGYPLNSIWIHPVLAYNDINKDGVLTDDEVIVGDSVVYAGWNHPRYSLSYGTTFSLFNGRISVTSNLAYDAKLTQRQAIYDDWGSQSFDAPLYEQAKARINNGGMRQTISVLRFNAASATIMLPDAWARQFRATAASISLQGQNLGLWTRYRGRDPGVNSNPIGEQTVDNGRTLPQPRTYAVTLRLNF